MLLLERDPLVITEWPRDVASNEQRPGSLQHIPRRFTLLLWMVIVALMHFDRGVATVAALDITAWDGGSVHASFGYAVALLAWHSLGLAIGGVLAGAAFQQFSAKIVLVLALLANAGTLLILGFQAHVHLAAVCLLRLISGFCASLPLVFLPLWVDEFSPSEAQAQWMALVQLGAPIGQFIGAVVGGMCTVIASNGDGLNWRFALMIQAAAFVPVTLRLLFIPSLQVEVANIASLRARLDSLTLYPADASQVGHVHGLIREMREMVQGLSRNPLNVALTVSLFFLHATVAGLALWATPYLALSPGAPPPFPTLIVMAMLLALAPVVGTYIGALLNDRFAGFKAGHHTVALRVACGFLALCCVSVLISCVSTFGPRFVFIFIWLFGAGAFLPISAGILMTSMPSYLRSFSTASSTLVIHVISFAVVPILAAGVMSCFSTPKKGLSFGVGSALWLSVPAALLVVVATLREPKQVMPTGLSGVDDLTFSEISYELSRRRMTTAPL